MQRKVLLFVLYIKYKDCKLYIFLQSAHRFTLNFHMWTLATLFRFACDTSFLMCLIEKSLLVLSAWLDLFGFDSVADFTQSGSGEREQGRGRACLTLQRSLHILHGVCLAESHQWFSLSNTSAFKQPLQQLLEQPNRRSNSLTHHIITCQNAIHVLNGSGR